jgi:hypothetical protein
MFEDYSKENPQRSHIEGGVRVVWTYQIKNV